jgi:hypothetical protein
MTNIDIDIDYNAASAANILRTYLNVVKKEKEKVNGLYNDILKEFEAKDQKDPSKGFKKVLDDATATANRADQAKWDILVLKLAEAMRENADFSSKIDSTIEYFKKADHIDLDIDNIAVTACRILSAFLNGYKSNKDRVNELCNTIRDEFSQDTTGESIKVLDEAINARTDSEKWGKFVSRLSSAMKASSEFSGKVQGLTNALRPPPDKKDGLLEKHKMPKKDAIRWLLGSLAGIFISGWFGDFFTGIFAGFNYLLVLFFMLLFIRTIGLYTTGRASGVLINSRKLMSLSRMQTVIWTMIILSGFLTIALSRVHANLSTFAYNSTLNETFRNSAGYILTQSIADPLAIPIDWQLWALMGISAASLIGTPLIQDSKRRTEPDESSLSKSSQTLNQSVDVTQDNRQGLLYGNPSISDAAFTDIFQGDELVNTNSVDLSKVQMFWFTIIVAFAYLVEIYSLVATTHPALIRGMPELSEGLIALLGISHAGYLANKGITRTGVASDEEQ